MEYNVHHPATSPSKCLGIRSLKSKGIEKWFSIIWFTIFVFLLFLFVQCQEIKLFGLLLTGH